jgi:hypothetical protein
MFPMRRSSFPHPNARPAGRRLGFALAAVLFGCALGCGSGGAAANIAVDGATGCPASFSPGASMGWQDDGKMECAQIVSATYEAGTASTSFSIVGSSSSGLGVSFGVASTAGGVAIGGSYSCGLSGNVDGTFDYEQGSTPPTFADTCSMTINSADGAGGTPATGTFSATLNLSGGGTKIISNGVFTTPVTVVGG